MCRRIGEYISLELFYFETVYHQNITVSTFITKKQEEKDVSLTEVKIHVTDNLCYET